MQQIYEVPLDFLSGLCIVIYRKIIPKIAGGWNSLSGVGWRQWAEQFIYRRAYEDCWGVFHSPAREWDELLKYYQHWVRLKVSDADRRLARPASTAAVELIHEEAAERRRLQSQVYRLETDYLKWVNRRKQWKRRMKAKANVVKQ